MDYSELDERIIESIRAGNKSTSKIAAHLNTGKFTRDPGFIDSRLLDRRLQLLQQRGRLIYTGSTTRSHWKLNEDISA